MLAHLLIQKQWRNYYNFTLSSYENDIIDHIKVSRVPLRIGHASL